MQSFKQAEIKQCQSKLDASKEERDQLKYLTEVQMELIETQRDNVNRVKALLLERENEILELKKSTK